MLGVLGGMGPLATVDFMQKIIAMSHAHNDQEHIPMLVHNVPQVPDRSACILQGMTDPFPALLAGLRKLEEGGATCAVIPCNTAHYWFEKLQQHSQVPMISILDCASEHIRRRGLKTIGLMATNATIQSEIYKQRIEKDNGVCLSPSELNQLQLMQAIYDIKGNNLKTGSRKMELVFRELLNEGAEAVILGCTEIPVGLESIIREFPELCIDATALLAQACVDWYYTDTNIAA